jgi:hypothetical protein
MSTCFEWWQSFCGFEVIKCERCPNKFTKKLLKQKNLGKGGRMGNIHKKGFLLVKLKTLIKTRFAIKVTMLEKCFEFKKVIFICYNKQKLVTLQ